MRYLLNLLLVCISPFAIGQEYTSGIDIEQKKQLFKKYEDSSDIFYNQANLVKSIDYSIKTLKIALEINEPKYLHQGYRKIAYDYLSLMDTISAKESFDKAKNYALESSNDTVIGLYYMDAANYSFLIDNDTKKAKRFHEKSIEIFTRTKDSVNLLKAYFNTILTHFENENYEEGMAYLNAASKIENGINDKITKIALHNLKAEYYIENKSYDLAQTQINNALELAIKDSLTYDLEISYGLLVDLYEKTNKVSEASFARNNYDKYYAINSADEEAAKKNAAAASFQVNQFRKEIEAAEIKNQLQAERFKTRAIINYILIGITIAGIILFAFFYRAYTRRKELVRLLQEKNKEYLQAKEESENLSKAKSKFFSTVSHELRTPLYGVIGLSTILLEDKSLKNHEEDLNSLKFSAEYLLALINDVLLINKIDANSTNVEITSFSVKDLIKKIVTSLEFMKLQNKNKIHINVSDEIPELLKGNVIHLSQVLMNLIGNACKFTEDGDITITASLSKKSSKKAMIDFSVKDTGIGIPKRKLEAIFEEFQQAESINYNYQGTGLGLPIVKRLLDAEGSQIYVESEIGEGTTFHFSLEFDVVQVKKEKKTDSISNLKDIEGKRILIVEDNRINQIVTRKILEKDKIICDLANNGKEAVDSVSNKNYDLILMDINMPVLDGLSATKKIRSFNKTVPIVALTAVEIEEMRDQIFESGMNDIIVKPYDAKKFRETIVKNISSKSTYTKKATA
ncbi:response regulator [Patiriisocius hiemis]|uniref:histidine kinase n=1 Tax=Patiriisocius hiemis TaxID=3075604 RepID=A0ABU2YFF1_9FLAO|nr:response regulator [Constantimarinum sp. W242]MDT0556487.1 response regulator [Constantimarinum sp. W242]